MLSLYSLSGGEPIQVTLKRGRVTVICFDEGSVHVVKERKEPIIGIFCGDLKQRARLLQQTKGISVYWAGLEGRCSAVCERLRVEDLPWQTILLDGEVLTAGHLQAPTLEAKCMEQELLIRSLEGKVRALTREVETYQRLFRRYAPVLPELRRSEDSSPLPSALELDYWESGSKARNATLRLEDIANRGLWIVQKQPAHRPFATQSIFPSRSQEVDPASPLPLKSKTQQQAPFSYGRKRKSPDVHRRSKSALGVH